MRFGKFELKITSISLLLNPTAKKDLIVFCYPLLLDDVNPTL